MNPSTPSSKPDRQFTRLVTWSAALSMGLAAGLLASVKQVNPTVEFRFTALSVIAFAAVGAFSLAVFQRIFRSTEPGTTATRRSRRKLVTGFAFASAAILIGSIAVALKNVPRERQVDFVAGALLAITVVAGVAWFAWKIVSFLSSTEDDMDVQERDSGGDRSAGGRGGG